jgi:hypothetical protein
VPKEKSETEEREIIRSHPEKRPYGALLRVHVQTAGAFGQVENVEIPFVSGAFLTLAPARSAPWDGGRKYSMQLEGFATATAAESAARRLVQAILWMAVSSDAPLRLDYRSYEPFSIFDRTRSGGTHVEAYGEVFFQPAMIFDEIKAAYDDVGGTDPALLLSMEIFASARLEASDRARFLSIVSALEPLASEQPLGAAADRLVESCLENLKATPDLTPEIRSSLEGRIRQLRAESIRQALRRTVRSGLPDRAEAVMVVDEAYSLRSQIIHDGRPQDLDVDLERQSQVISNILRELYAARLGRRLLKPIAV